MLRNVGVRTKLLGIIAVPMAFLLAVTGALVLQAVSAATQAERVRQLTVASAQLNRLVHGFQAERSATMNYLATRSPEDRVVMKGIRAKVDAGLVQLRTTIAHSPVDQVSHEVADAVALAARQHDGIGAIRAKVDSDRYFESEVQTYYDTVIATDLQLPGLVAESAGSAQLAQELRAYQALSTMIEASAKERDLLGNVLRLDQIGRDDFVALSGYVAQQNSQLDTFRKLASTDQSQQLSTVLARSDIFGMEEARREAGDLLVGKTVPADAAAKWLKASNGRIDALSNFEALTVRGIADQAGAAASAARRTAALDVLVALLGLGLAVLVTVALARRMVRPLRRLTAAAAQVGEELPNMVARMQTPGEGPGVEIEP
ncbi:MAG TPA: nitrate- and nitrite sensing domain-containing protein, partial [Candidatus Eisenbacteria bacterium]|nr:nitrate- and nitrite sensing domain-containing protein [Candidatus Eisenbacteria bacterium]